MSVRFREEPTLFNFAAENDNENADEATKELLEEVDRSLKGFEQAARSHAWLGDLGVNAEAQLLTEANHARALGAHASTVDLAQFVCNSVLLDGGDLTGTMSDDVFELLLPPAWNYGLDDLPGYDPTTRRLRLTTKLEVTSDARERPVGFLGRAPPLVRRALDRVRNLSFGGSARAG
ncbi:MAG: hypothetical protein HY268_28100 [Deltaproteobacteria bacterium]|nr:hypothetical protein [Deltaproteobacteria bacterium]